MCLTWPRARAYVFVRATGFERRCYDRARCRRGGTETHLGQSATSQQLNLPQFAFQVLQQPEGGREEGAAAVLCPAEARCPRSRHRQADARHPRQAGLLRMRESPSHKHHPHRFIHHHHHDYCCLAVWRLYRGRGHLHLRLAGGRVAGVAPHLLQLLRVRGQCSATTQHLLTKFTISGESIM